MDIAVSRRKGIALKYIYWRRNMELITYHNTLGKNNIKITQKLSKQGNNNHRSNDPESTHNREDQKLKNLALGTDYQTENFWWD